MLDIDKLPKSVIASIAYNLGAEDESEIAEYLDEIKRMTPRRAFVCYCTWKGLIGWGGDLFDLVENLQNANDGNAS